MTIPGPDTDDATNLGGLPSTHEVEDFSKKVTEVSILVDGLRNGTISPAYVDSKLAQVKPQVHSWPCLSGTKSSVPCQRTLYLKL